MKKLLFMLALSVSLQGIAKESFSKADENCLILAVHKESGAESLRGSRGVLDVILHRVYKSGKSACQVIKARSQFSFVRKGMSWKTTQQMRDRYAIVSAMPKVFKDKRVMWFHATHVKPSWSRELVKVGVVGSHIYYRVK